MAWRHGMNELLGYLPPFLAFLLFFVLIRRQGRRTGRSWMSPVGQLREQAQDPPSLFGMAAVVAVFLVYVAIKHPSSWGPAGYGVLGLLVVLLVGAGAVASRRRGA
jgi:hypothetical protein